MLRIREKAKSSDTAFSTLLLASDQLPTTPNGIDSLNLISENDFFKAMEETTKIQEEINFEAEFNNPEK